VAMPISPKRLTTMTDRHRDKGIGFVAVITHALWGATTQTVVQYSVFGEFQPTSPASAPITLL
jgi:hypothetical protein